MYMSVLIKTYCTKYLCTVYIVEDKYFKHCYRLQVVHPDDHLSMLVQLGSSFEMNLPEPPHRNFTNLKKADWDSVIREAKASFTRLQLPSSCSTGESQFRKILNSSSKHPMSQGHIHNMTPNLTDVMKLFIVEPH